jgi:hypothetical protein
MASEMPAMTKASASCFLENLAVFEDGVSALVGFLLGSVGFHNSAAADRVGSRSWTAQPLFIRFFAWPRVAPQYVRF